jgi:hypothetical protein
MLVHRDMQHPYPPPADRDTPPPDRKNVSYEFLAQLVGEYILITAPDVDVSAAVSMMLLTTTDYQ